MSHSLYDYRLLRIPIKINEIPTHDQQFFSVLTSHSIPTVLFTSHTNHFLVRYKQIKKYRDRSPSPRSILSLAFSSALHESRIKGHPHNSSMRISHFFASFFVVWQMITGLVVAYKSLCHLWKSFLTTADVNALTVCSVCLQYSLAYGIG